MLKGLKIIGILPKKEIRPIVLLLLIAATELLALGWLTFLIFRK
jgi:hypothetical protein